MLPRLLRKDDFVARFERRVTAQTAEELQAVVASVAASSVTQPCDSQRAIGKRH